MNLNEQTSKFYLICPIGLEHLLKKELEQKWSMHFPGSSYNLIAIDRGGLLIECHTQAGLALNQILKGSTRILMRVKEQKCRDLPKLFNIVKKIKWKDYLNQTTVEFTVTAKKSRLIHSGKIQKTCEDGVKAYFQANKISKKVLDKYKDARPQKIYIRLNEDNLEISLDSTGELAHIRGDRKRRGHAPIRETYATLLLLDLLDYKKYNEHNLIDPMCGTGTFLFEAKNHFKLNARSFSYQSWKDNFQLELNEVETDLWDFKSYKGFDIDEAIIEQNKKLSKDINFALQDAFKSEVLKEKNLVIINPPYGKRVEIQGKKNIFFQNLKSSLESAYSPAKLGMIIPADFNVFPKQTKTSFNQNGISIHFYRWNQ